MSHRPPGGMSPRSSRSMAARMRFSLAARWSAVIRMLLLVVGVRAGCVDGVQDAQRPVVVGLQSCPLGLAGRAEAGEEGPGLHGVLGPDGPVAGWWVACG